MPDLASIDLAPLALLTVCGALFAGGLVKGAAGFGLPLVAVPLLAFVFPVPQAIALMMLPILASNIFILARAPALKQTVVRLWPLILSLCLGLAISARLLKVMDPAHLLIGMGIVVLIFVAQSVTHANLRVRARQEPWMAPIMGLISGLIGGVTGFFSMPAIAYLSALGLGKDGFVTAVCLTLMSGGVTMTVMLNRFGFLTLYEVVLSGIGLVPLLIGIALGQRLRHRISHETFNRVVLVLMAVVGLSMIARGF
ncbi:MAG: sulfite exporter TauE/SafE family protein [Rhodobacterales bacterium]|nr:sulfite exporter TauE/SafE family protein [Rhodobacterales bacterium]